MKYPAPIMSETAAYDWYIDRYQAVYVSRNRWLVVAIVALGLAFTQAIALVGLVPLKTSVPFLIKEETSGSITTVTPLKGDSAMTYQESVRKYFLAEYVVKRETYDAADLADNYKAVSLMSAPEQKQEFARAIAIANPRSPLVIYGNRSKRWIRIKSLSFLNDHLAQVRFTATEKTGSAPDAQTEWVAIVGFRFGLVPALESDRLIDPLGFLVTSYRTDQEVVP